MNFLHAGVVAEIQGRLLPFLSLLLPLFWFLLPLSPASGLEKGSWWRSGAWREGLERGGLGVWLCWRDGVGMVVLL